MVDSGALQVDIRRSLGLAVVRVHGELDLFTLPALAAALVEAAEQPLDYLLLDLTGAAFIDVLTLNLISHTAGQLASEGCTLHVRGLSDHQRRVWRLAGLQELVPVG